MKSILLELAIAILTGLAATLGAFIGRALGS